MGYRIVSSDAPAVPDYLTNDDEYRSIIEAVGPYTMTSPARIAAVVDGVRHVSRRGIRGAIVECGVWRGGSSMAAAMALQQEGDIRDIYLFDTFGGMTAPTGADVDFRGLDARDQFAPDHDGTDKG